MKLLAALLMLLSFMAAMPRAKAQTPISSTTYTNDFQGITKTESSKSAVCSSIAATYNASHGMNDQYYPMDGGAVVGGGTQICRWNGGPNNLYGVRELDSVAFTVNTGGTTCPGNSASNGSGGCACPGGSPHWDPTGGSNGYCFIHDDVCSSGSAQSYGGAMPAAKTFCDGKCVIKPAIGTKLKNGHQEFTGIVTGDKCTLPPPNETPVDTTPPNPCGAGTVPVPLNGQTLCLSIGKPGADVEWVQRDETKAVDNAITTTTKETTCSGTNCRTDTMTTYTNPDGSPGGTSSASTTSVGLPGGGGGGGGGGICDDSMKDTLLCAGLGTPTDVALGSEAKGPDTISPVDVGGNAGSCPADISLPHGMSFSFAPVCTMANSLRPVVLALAWLSAGLIVLGGMRKYG